MKLKSKKSALLLSFTSLLLCFAMLAGSTFAWFTDTATTGVNKIVSGKLDVDIVDAADTTKSLDKQTLKWVRAKSDTEKEAVDSAEILWEPGCTYQLQSFRIANKGNLALKYKIQITGIQGDAKLNEVIEWKINDQDINLTEKHLLAGTANNPTYSEPITISGHMKEKAGNEYQNKSIDGIAITVYATQLNSEFDSFNNTYDENATYYPVLDAAGLKDALVNGGNIKVDDDVSVAPVVEDITEDTLVPQMTLTKDTTLDLSGNKISVQHDATTNFGKASPVLMAVMDGTLTIEGNGEINCEAGTQQVYGINVNGGNVVVNDGKFYGAITAIQVQKGSLVINGGFFDMAPTCKAQVPQYAKYIINCIDANYKNGSAKIIVTGGTFVNFDPSANPEGAGTTYVADGYSVISEQHGADTWYTVVKGTGVVAGTQDALNEGIANSATKDITVVMPANSSVTLDNGIANDDAKARDITFVGDGSQTVDIHTDDKGENGNKLNYQRGSTFTFENLTVTAATSGNYEGIVCDGLTYKNCTIKGIQWLYAENVEFINCKFIQENDDTYHLWTYGAKNVTFTDCEFSSTSKSKAVLCYTDAENGKTYTRTFNNCTFRATGEAEKSAIMINPSAHSNVNTYVININNCTATGYAENGISGQTIVGVKETVKDTITVTIDGTMVYTH